MTKRNVRYTGPSDAFIWAGEREFTRDQIEEVDYSDDELVEMLTYPGHGFDVLVHVGEDEAGQPQWEIVAIDLAPAGEEAPAEEAPPASAGEAAPEPQAPPAKAEEAAPAPPQQAAKPRTEEEK